MRNLSHYTALAEMFRYPTNKLQVYSGHWKNIIKNYHPSLLPKLELFTSHIHERSLAFQQEYFISTFDVQAMCYLDIGYVLFGEDHKRGIFMVNIKREQEKAGNDCGTELPDHLPNILTLLPMLKDENLAEEMVYSLLIPSIKEMISKFLKTENLYKGLLEILVAIMESDYSSSSFEQFDFTSWKRQQIFNHKKYAPDDYT